jgi:uncharacterized membrane protein YgcG
VAVGEISAGVQMASSENGALPPVEPRVTDHGAEVEHPPTHGSLYDGIAEGPFTASQLVRLDEALRGADQRAELTFSVYVGDLDGDDRRAAADRLHDRLADPDNSVLLAVSPNQRAVEIVTGALAAKKLPDRICALAALSMTSSFSGGDLAGGLVTGLRMLADQARVP